MLTFSRDQFEKLEKVEIDRFKQKLFIRFRTDYPKQTSQHSDQRLTEIIEDSTEAGLEIGIKTEGPLSQFVGISVLLCEKFYDLPEIKTQLEYSGFTADDKVSFLVEKINETLRN